MEKLLMATELLKSLMKFSSKEEIRIILNGFEVKEDGSLCSTDGRRLIMFKKELYGNIPAGIYKYIGKPVKESRDFSFIMVEKIEGQFPDYMRLLDGFNKTDIKLCYQKKEDVSIYIKCYEIFQELNIALNPALLMDLPENEGFDVYSKESIVKLIGGMEFGITVLVMALRVPAKKSVQVQEMAGV
jgi:hypothetical protein